MWPDVIWASAQKYPKIQKQKVKGHQTSDSELFWFTVNDQTLCQSQTSPDMKTCMKGIFKIKVSGPQCRQNLKKKSLIYSFTEKGKNETVKT